MPGGLAALEGNVLLVTDETLLAKYRELFPAHFHVECLEGIEISYMQGRSAALPAFDTVVGFGGGVCVDGAKYFAWQHAKPCYLVPTAISVDACYSYAIALRRGNVVFYEGEVLPVRIAVDTSIIRAAPKQLNLSGVGDVLSCYTALHDWKLLDAAGKTPPLDARQYEGAQQLLADMFAGAAEIRDMTDAGIQLLMDAYKWVGIEGYQSRHCHFEEGCEHFLAYTIESVCGKRMLHGQLVSMCVYIMSKLQRAAR